MKKIFVFAALCTAIACGSSDNNDAEQKSADSSSNANATAPTPATTTNANDAGLEMIGALDCTTCHKISEKNIGPAYTDVAKKYEATDANIEMLAKKIIDGGSGTWGSVPMTPHPGLSLDSSKTMVKYILSLRNQ
jgi:cytochrome c